MFSRRLALSVDGARTLAARPGPAGVSHRLRILRRGACILIFAALFPLVGKGAMPPVHDARVGPLNVSADSRRIVRGGRDEHASLYVAWTPPASLPDRDDRRALESFERATFPPTNALHRLAGPPERWMADLTSPDLPLAWTRRTVEYLQYFKDDPRGKAMMRAWMRRAGRYETRMRSILREVGVPEDLVMVALAESGFNPRVRSAVGAAGPWQFMEGTGHVYGLRTEYWVDERFDIEKSTYAAALYLKDLHARFGSWELALAAYNAGYGLVLTTIERHNTNDFWELCEIESGLPYATTNYVPKILASAIISRNRSAFGVDPRTIDPLPPADWVDVQVQQSTSIERLASILGVDKDLLAELNAHLIRGRTPPRRGAYRIRIPRDATEAFRAAGARLREAWSTETTVRTRHGESVAELASAHGLDERSFRALNGIRDAAEVTGGLHMVVPVGGSPTSPPAASPLLAAVPDSQGPAGSIPGFFVVTRATTPATFEAMGLRWADVVQWNGLDPYARLQSNQVLLLWLPTAFDADAVDARILAPERVQWVQRGSLPHLHAALERRGLARRGVRVRKGDTLQKIGRRFDLTVGSIARINGLKPGYAPRVGELLIVYVEARRQGGTVAAPPPKSAAPRSAAVVP